MATSHGSFPDWKQPLARQARRSVIDTSAKTISFVDDTDDTITFEFYGDDKGNVMVFEMENGNVMSNLYLSSSQVWQLVEFLKQ